MKAKAYLEEIEKLNTKIKNKTIEKDQWWDIAVSSTASYSGERVQSSGSQQKNQVAIATYMDYDRQIKKLIEKKNEIISTIEQLPTEEYDVLHKRYVQGMEFQEIADSKGLSYSWATTVHGRARAHVQKIIDQRGL